MTRRQNVTTAPTALAGTAEDTQYSIQNVGSHDVYLATASTAPAQGDAAFIRRSREAVNMTPGTGESVYAWTAAGTSAVAYEETA